MSFYDFGGWGYLSALALIAWIPVTAYLFRRHSPTRAAAFSLVHAMMWLPQLARFDLPAIPPMDKSSIAVICVIVFGYLRARKRLRAAGYGSMLDLVFVVLALGNIGTVQTNGDPLRYGVVFLPPMVPYDGVSFALRDFIAWGLPLIAGRAFIRTSEDLREVLRVLMVCALVYAVPILYELRMSPMLHVNIYGFSGHGDWMQNVRDGAYRATVFMGHGLVVGFFLCVGTLAAITLRVSGAMTRYRRFPMWLVIIFLFGMLALQKATAALIFVSVGACILMLLSVKAQLRVAVIIAVVLFTFPLLRITGTFPTDDVVAWANENFGEERAQSIEFRFQNEELMLVKGQERPTFGWGGFGRERIYDPWSGRDLTTQDGMWIIVYSGRGLWGFLSYFALHLLPVAYLWRRLKLIKNKQERGLLAGTAIMVVMCTLNMIPNGEMANIPLFLASGLFTVTREASKPKRRVEAPAEGPVATAA